MPFPNSRVSFGDVLDAIAAKLVADQVVPSLDKITWATPKNHPVLEGASDLMLVTRGGKHEGKDGGPAQFQVLRYVDVWLRSQVITDPGVALKEWIRGMFVTGDKVLDSIGCDGFHPEDGARNLLTVEPIMLVEDQPPDYTISGAVYGECVAVLSCLYMPHIDPAKGVFP